MLSEGNIIAVLATMIFTSIIKWIKNKIKNEKIKHLIPNGFILALIVGLGVCIYIGKLELLNDKIKTIWNFLETWIVICGLSGYGNIAGNKLLIFIKALLSDKQTQIAQAELEIQQLKEKQKKREETIEFINNKN